MPPTVKREQEFIRRNHVLLLIQSATQSYLDMTSKSVYVWGHRPAKSG